MDFHSLSRRELQALCKRNKIPANTSNAAMADSLKALEIVEGIDDVLQACKSEISQSSTEPRARLEVTSPYVPPIGGRSTRQKDVLLTPAQSGATSRRRRAANEVYGTRRSARLAEKSAKLLKGVTEFSKKDLFTGDGHDFQMNLEESLDGSDEMSGVTGTEEPQRRDEGQVDSGDKQDVSTDVELAPTTEEEVRTHFENYGPQLKLKEGVDANTSVEVNSGNIELNESRGAEIEQVGSGSGTEEFVNFDDTKASHDETRSPIMNYESQKTDVLDVVVQTENIEEKTAEDAEFVDEKAVSENEDDLAIVEVSSDTVSQSDDKVNDVDSKPDEVVAFYENEEELELNTSYFSNPDEYLIEASKESNDSLACMPSEISLMSNENGAFNWDDYKTCKQDVAAEEPATYVTAKQDDPLPISLENCQTHQLFAVATNNIGTAFMENAPSKASARMSRVTADTDNKENIGSVRKERLKICKDIAETVHMLDDPTLITLSKSVKELAITQNLDKNEGENGASARTALRALPDN
ncbi:uncharacterized protein LOC131016085 [Salvia miltiorrhiza]|uniref:uncharacterized protein LOC131016085 n=1 Tax=Salvia miltiorrhiza TaxID=226208 RepID=UPI0025ABEA0C|nr:uncharacterized protein LOC131016085 [Salvia miltiorrhiza]